jgi:dihydrodipicolinate synthase/N-acetylneuraminate lyase
MRDFNLTGFTTGSGCIAPALCSALFDACQRKDWDSAEAIRSHFIPFEDLRDAWGPARVLHQGTELAGIAPTGPIPPFVSPLTRAELDQLSPIAHALRDATA